MTRYRYVTPTTKGRWRDTKEQAQDAAVRAGFGSRDPHTRRFFAHPLVRIEED